MRRVTPSLVVAVLALVLACAGGAAASHLITGSQIKDSSITGRDVKDRSLSPADFTGSVQGPAGPQGAAGPQGPAGPTGPQGPAGPSTTSALHTVTAQMSIDPNAADGGVLGCPAGEKVVSGGFYVDAGTVFLDAPTTDRTGWALALDNQGNTSAAELDAYALCAGSGKAVTARARMGRLSPLTGRLARMLARRDR